MYIFFLSLLFSICCVVCWAPSSTGSKATLRSRAHYYGRCVRRAVRARCQFHWITLDIPSNKLKKDRTDWSNSFRPPSFTKHKERLALIYLIKSFRGKNLCKDSLVGWCGMVCFRDSLKNGGWGVVGVVELVKLVGGCGPLVTKFGKIEHII